MAVQWLRIPALLALLGAAALPVEAVNHAIARLEGREVWMQWALISALSMGFVVVVLTGRRRRHPWVVLAIEAAVSAALAFVPPMFWVIWRGIDSWSVLMASGTAQPLATAWLGVVGLRAFHQRPGRRAGTPLELVDSPDGT